MIDAAKRIGYGKTAVFKILKRHGIATEMHRNANHNGQAIAYISLDDFNLIQNDVETRNQTTDSNDDDYKPTANLDTGFFYLIQLEPDHDAGRFKLGFAANVNERLRSHKCSAPFSILIKSWPCKRIWERTAIDCVTHDCEQLHTEVFRTSSIDDVVAKCDTFFTMMPPPTGNSDA